MTQPTGSGSNSMTVETRFWIVIAIMAFGAGLSFLGRLGMWAVFHYGAKGKLKVRVVLSEEDRRKAALQCRRRD